jgi:hypothetical protein
VIAIPDGPLADDFTLPEKLQQGELRLYAASVFATIPGAGLLPFERVDVRQSSCASTIGMSNTPEAGQAGW